jgi:deoxyribodipyrimidine photo-lyase
MSLAIHWFRRDLRITDNTAFDVALAAHDELLPLYVVSVWRGRHWWCGAPRQDFLCGCLASLSKNLEAKGGRLIVRTGEADQVIAELLRETGADAVYCNRDPDPFGRAMEARVEAVVLREGAKFVAMKDVALHEREEVMTAGGTPFQVFTPYARAWLKLEKAGPRRFRGRVAVPTGARSEDLPTLATWGLQREADVLTPGEAAARRRLDAFMDGPVIDYGARRDLPAVENTSRLSQDLRFGLLSIREVYAKCREVADRLPAVQRRGVEIFVNELIWREFYMQVLWHHPDVLDHELQEQYRGLAWRDHWRPGDKPPSEAFERWCRGETGFPIVDAGMRQLMATGFMHNRVRMIVAMFLTKDLHLWWMHGESWFMQRLVDGEIASNNGGWQWSASTGTDAAPYFRIQNPWSQTKRYDPEGEYIRRWVPELRDLPGKRLCDAPTPGMPLAKGYPLPMVDHAIERDAALAMFKGV